MKDFSHITKPLNQVTKQDAQWSWKLDGPEQVVFDKLKPLITVSNKTIHMFESFGLCIQYIILFNG